MVNAQVLNDRYGIALAIRHNVIARILKGFEPDPPHVDAYVIGGHRCFLQATGHVNATNRGDGVANPNANWNGKACAGWRCPYLMIVHASILPNYGSLGTPHIVTVIIYCPTTRRHNNAALSDIAANLIITSRPRSVDVVNNDQRRPNMVGYVCRRNVVVGEDHERGSLRPAHLMATLKRSVAHCNSAIRQ